MEVSYGSSVLNQITHRIRMNKKNDNKNYLYTRRAKDSEREDIFGKCPDSAEFRSF